MEHTIGERNIYFIILAAGMQPKTYNTSHDLYVKLVHFVNLDRKEQLVYHSLGMDFEHAHLYTRPTTVLPTKVGILTHYKVSHHVNNCIKIHNLKYAPTLS